MGGIRQQVAGGASPAKRQFEDEVLRTTPEVRCRILKNAKINLPGNSISRGSVNNES